MARATRMLRRTRRARAATRRGFRAWFRARPGATLPFTILLFVTFIGVAAVAVDISRMYMIHGQLQTSAEAGALAGANRLVNDDGANAADSALDYSRRNHADGVSPDVSEADVVFGQWNSTARLFTPTSGWSDPNTNAVQMTTHHTGSYVFAPIYGIHNRALKDSAVAAAGSITATSCIRPLTVSYWQILRLLGHTNPSDVLTYSLDLDDINTLISNTATMVLQLESGDPSVTSPSYGLLNLFENTGGGDVREGLRSDCSALQQVVHVGDWLEQKSGGTVGAVRQGLGGNPLCSASGTNFTCAHPVPYLLPVWDKWQKVGGHVQYHVRYIGVFYATGYNTGGVVGYLHAMNVSGEWSGEPGPAMSIVLVR